MKKQVLRALGKIFTHEHVEKVENPVEEIHEEIIEEIRKPRGRKKKDE